MLFDSESLLSSPHPFWFASTDLLTSVLAAEVNVVSQLLANHPDIRNLFDAPEATVAERRACFEVLAHRMFMDIIYEMFAARYEQSPFPADTETRVLNCTQNLVTLDAPTWVLEMSEVVKLLAFHINDALPEPLRTAGFGADNSARAEAIKSAAKTLNSAEQIQVLTGGVLDQQLRRLERRWSATMVHVPEPKKRKARRTHDRRRMIRDKLIAEIDEVSKTPREFLRLMDERKVQPQPTWNNWPGSWVQAYLNPHLRALIHKDKSRALARVRTTRET